MNKCSLRQMIICHYHFPLLTLWTVTNRVVINMQPNWPEIYRGESITLTCDIVGGEENEWEYEWNIRPSYTRRILKEYTIEYASSSDNGEYRCLGREKSLRSDTRWSDAFRLTISTSESHVITHHFHSLTVKC